jgi:proteasome lid subunit RPN8/RPN11
MMQLAEARIYTGELALLYQLVAESPDLETGGELLGLWSHQGSPTIMLVTGPDTNATRTETHFMQPPDIHMMIERHMWDGYGLQVLGIWHSHHRLGLRELSKGDRLRTQRYASNHGRLRYIELLGYLDDSHPGKPEIRPYLYSDAPQLAELPVNVLELPGRSPIRDALTRHPPPMALHTSLLLGGPTVKRAARLPTGVSADLESQSPRERVNDSAVDADLPDDTQSDPDVALLSECHLHPEAEVEALAAEQAVQDREDAVVDIVLALENALARLPESATRFVRLSLEESEMQLSIDTRGHRAKLRFRATSPREIEYLRKATAYPVLYTAGSHELLADFYYQRLVHALNDAAPGVRAPIGQARAT